jgi:hypothetical protein
MLMSYITYSMALRCIGQDLERRRLSTFTIKRDGSQFVVFASGGKAPATTQEIVRYTASDIELMDRCGETQRGETANPEFLHRAQMLRAIGEYLDKYSSTLISITAVEVQSNESPFRVEYITREGERVIDDQPGAAIFDQCVLMFQKRSPTTAAGNPSARR